MSEIKLEVGKRVKFRFKQRKIVFGRIVSIIEMVCWIRLEKDYRGKNDMYYAGDMKAFRIKEMDLVREVTH